MTLPIERGVSLRAISANALTEFLTRELMPMLASLRTIANESASHFEAPSANYAWNLDMHGSLFLEPTTSIQISADADSLAKLREGRRYLLHVYNATGGNITITFTSDFTANAPAIASGSTATWEFVVLHHDSTLSSTLAEI